MVPCNNQILFSSFLLVSCFLFVISFNLDGGEWRGGTLSVVEEKGQSRRVAIAGGGGADTRRDESQAAWRDESSRLEEGVDLRVVIVVGRTILAMVATLLGSSRGRDTRRRTGKGRRLGGRPMQ